MQSAFMKKLSIFSFRYLFIILIAELFLFNYKSFLLHPLNRSNYPEKQFSIGSAESYGISLLENDIYQVTADRPSITFFMNQPVETMFFDASVVADSEIDTASELVVNISYATDSYNQLRASNKKFTIVKAVPNSKYVTCSYFGNVKQIRLMLDVNQGTLIHLQNFSVNSKIPLHFSFTRVVFLFIVSLFIFIYLKYPTFSEKTDFQRPSHKYAAACIIGLFLLLILFTYHMYTGDYNWRHNTSGNQMTQELVDAFAHKQVSLIDEVPKELLELDNPYDWSERLNAGLNYKWDHLLFDGKYYSYYGIAPVITLFFPYYLVTGYYFPSSLACLMYSLLAALFLGLCYLSVVRNWFSETPFRLTMSGLILTLFSSCVIINVYATQFYEIAQSSALCFLTAGFFFMLNSNIFIPQKKIRLSFLFFSSLFVSLSVLSRATCAVYAVIMVFWLVYGFLQYGKETEKNRKAMAKYAICSFSPYIVFASIQIVYNYLRFGSPFEFGIQYSLTIGDFTNPDMHFGIVMISIVNFLFSIPIINTTFPFIHGNYDSLGINGYYFVATHPVFGILPSVLPTVALIYAPKIAKQFNFKEKLRLFLLWFLPGIFFPLILILMTWEHGYAMRYNSDFGWQLCLAALVIIFYTYNRLKEKTIKKWLFRVFFIATIWCILCYMASIFSANPLNSVAHNVNGAEIFYKIRSLVSFWG